MVTEKIRRIKWNGKPATLSVLTDITERKRAEAEREELQAQLLQAQKMESVGRLAGGIAHDFNNMLSAIIGYAEQGLIHCSKTDPLHPYLNAIRKAGQRSADLTQQLLAFARKQSVSPRILNLNDTVAGMLKMLQRLIGEDIDITWMPQATLRPVRMDPSQIDQILANLCVNARDAISGCGKITMAPGFIAEDLEKAFQHEVLKMLKKEGKINDAIVENILSWHHSGFHVYVGGRILPDDETGLEKLAK